MRVVFIGSVYFSKKMLEELIKLRVNIVGVCAKKKTVLVGQHPCM